MSSPTDGRHLDERLALAAPGAFRLMRRVVMRSPPGSLVRRRLVKRWAVRGWDAVARGDMEIVLLALYSDYEVNVFGAPLRTLGFAEHYHGHAGMREFMESWLAEWGSIDYKVEHVFDFGDRIAMRFTGTSRGAASGAEVAATSGVVYYLKNGTVVRQDFYWEWADCAAALGLRP